MLPEEGPIVARASVSTESWLDALRGRAAVFAASPSSARGWFEGRAIIAWSPRSLTENASHAEAADHLQLTFDSAKPCLTVALLPYDGSAIVVRYTGGLIRTVDGWRVWGTLDAASVPAPTRRSFTLPPASPLAVDVRTDLGAAAFRAGVRHIAEAIRGGDVYVLNLTRRVSGTPTTDPVDGFASLVARTQAEMAAFWSTPSVTLASASPERFIRVQGDRISVCPVKGTRPRAAGDGDARMAAGLARSEKERAEHVMIVDLERNDLGRVCRPGSVTVDPLFEVVATPYCHQMISCVSGVLRAGVSIAETLGATFPCGSVTGAPKIAAMETIARLEPSRRDAYTGSLVVAVPGELDSSVLIRTAEYRDELVRWGTGAGITVDSDPGEEWLETVLKASPFMGDGSPSVALRETCRIVGRRVPLMARHLARLAGGGCGPKLLARVRVAVAEAVARSSSAHSRLSVIVRPDGTLEVGTSDAASSLAVPGGPVPIVVEAAIPPLPAGVAKPAERGPWDEAQRHANEAGGHQAILIDPAHRVIDGATASVWIRAGRRLMTPPSPPAIDGIGRGVVFDLAADCGYVAHEADMTVDMLRDAEEIFFSNALLGIVPARGGTSQASSRLQEAFHALLACDKRPGRRQPTV